MPISVIGPDKLRRSLADALAAHRAGRLDEADAIYRRIQAAVPGLADAHHLGALVAFQKGDVERARTGILRAIELAPDQAIYHANLARICRALGRPEEAVAAGGSAIRLDPGNAEAHSDLAGALVALGQMPEAAEAARRALALAANLAPAHHNLGLALKALGDEGEAEAHFLSAVAREPGLADAHFQLGLLAQEQGRLGDAVAGYRAAVTAAPGLTEAWCNLGNVLRDGDDLVQAIAAYRRALEIAPERAEIHANLAVALHERGEIGAAIEAYDRALVLDPDLAEARRNRAMTLLLAGRLAEGWEDYESRWRTRAFEGLGRDLGVPVWDGSDLAGSRILVHAEQGLGDTLQFVRYAPLVSARGGRVVLECDRRLAGLLRSAAGVAAVVARGEPLPAVWAHVPLMSLPRLFATTLTTIPAEVPYLAADPDRMSQWRDLVADAKDLDVGLAWAGNPTHRNDRNRSLPVHLLNGLAGLPGIRFYSLQVGERAREVAELGALGVRDTAPRLRDFSDTAAAVSVLDLVISVDTAVAHLAGALARPTWVLLPFVAEWRWLIGRDSSPWYPTAKLFRQTVPGDWAGVIARVRTALADFAAENQRRPA